MVIFVSSCIGVAELQRSINPYIYAHLYPEEIPEENIKSWGGTIITVCIWRVLWLQNRTVCSSFATRAWLSWSTRAHGLPSSLLFHRHCACTGRKAWHCWLWSTMKHSCLTLWCLTLPLAECPQQFQRLVTSHATLQNCNANDQSWAKGSTKKHGVKSHNDLTSSLLTFALLKIISVEF